jgi:tetratricopeptide (TPR) repeat protein
VSDLFTGLLGVLLATNQPVALSNLVARQTGLPLRVAAANPPADPVEKEFEELMEADDAAQEEVDQWVREAEAATSKTNAITPITLEGRIQQRFDRIQHRYEEFLGRHPDHARARLAYGSFLGDRGDEDGSVEQWERSRQLDPKNPAAWNNLANYYGHRGPVKKAFEYYDKAIALNPLESVYYHNYGTTVFLFRKDAREHWDIDEQQVFEKALELYAKAMKLDPTNFILASDIAQTYYGIKPKPANDDDGKKRAEVQLADRALGSWTNAMALAGGPVEREGVLIHLARWEIRAGRFDDARAHLAGVSNGVYQEVKKRLVRNISEKEKPPAAPAAPGPQ